MAEQTTKPETVTKKRVLIDSKIIIEPNEYYFSHRTQEELAKSREQWAQEFRDFVRDHRSQDVNSVEVERTYQDQCTGCGREWEEDEDDNGVVICAWCGVPIEIVR